MMRKVMVVGLLVALIVIAALSIDEGEVVQLLTTDAESHVHETQVWIVEVEGVPYLRSSGPDARWLSRLRERNAVTVDLGGLQLAYQAVPLDDPGIRARVNEAMASKYGLADRLWGAFGDRTRVVPIRLDPGDDLAAGVGGGH